MTTERTAANRPRTATSLEPTGRLEVYRCGECDHLAGDHDSAICGAGWCPDMCRLAVGQVRERWPEPETIPVWASRMPSPAHRGPR